MLQARRSINFVGLVAVSLSLASMSVNRPGGAKGGANDVSAIFCAGGKLKNI